MKNIIDSMFYKIYGLLYGLYFKHFKAKVKRKDFKTCIGKPKDRF